MAFVLGRSHTAGVPELLMPVSVDDIDRRIKAAIDLFTRTYHPIDEQRGGWYHDLSDQRPGPVATAVVLLAFRLAGAKAPSPDACWAFLRHRQLQSKDPLRNGGWATNTTEDQPTVEATIVAARLIGCGTYGFAPFAPDSAAALRFLANHQNCDGGWGSLKDSPSRTTLTAQSLLAMASLCPDHPMLEAGVRWLIKHQMAAGGWGETPGANATVAHTALALHALAECGTDLTMMNASSAFDWLTSKVTGAPDNEIHAYVETYNISGSDQRQWRETMHHHGLALAATALLLHPHQPPGRALRRIYATLLNTQLASGEWASRQESPAPALWPTWNCLSALLDLRRAALLRPGDALVWLDHAVAVRRASGGSTPLVSLVTAPRGKRIEHFIRRRWASFLVAAATLVASVLAAVGVLTWPNAILTLLLPVLLLITQEAVARMRHTTDPKHSPSREP